MGLVDVLVLCGQLLDAPHQTLEGLLVLGHAAAGLHHRTARPLRGLVHHEAIEALDLAELALGRVHGTVAKALLHPEQVDPGLGQRYANLNVLAVDLANVGEIGPASRALDANLDASVNHVEEGADAQRELIVATRPRPKSHNLHEDVVGHLNTLERVGLLELARVHHVLVELEALGRDPLLCLDGYDVVAADNLLAVAQAVVEAHLDGGVDVVEKRDQVDTRARLVLHYAALLVQFTLVLVHDLFFLVI